MKTLRQENVVAVYSDLIPEKAHMKAGEMYISDKYLTASHLCLCGCGEEAALPMGEFGWQMKNSEKGLTVTPSIQQRFTCKSHYIIINGVANFV